MGIYIRDMTLDEFREYGDYVQTLIGTGQANEISPHGRLIDADALMLRVDCHGTNKFGMLDEDIREFIGCAPTIIPAEGGDAE